MENTKIFSVDAETNGLWGKAFAIAAIVRESGEETARFVARCPIEGTINEWVQGNVLPQMTGIPETHSSYADMLRDFAAFYMQHKADTTVIAHIPFPVETSLFRDMHDRGFIGDWDAPFPFIDVAAMLLQEGEDPASVDKYASDSGIAVPEFEGGTHNPLYDSAVTALVYEHLMLEKRAKK